MSDIYDFGLRLQSLRKQRKLSQQQVADMIGVDRATVSGYENNISYPSVDVLIKLSGIYMTSTDYILGLTGKDNCIMLSSDLSPAEMEYVKKMVHAMVEGIKELNEKQEPSQS